jgi:hypothetical protein
MAANLFVIFKGAITLRDIDAMSLEELFDWHARAMKRAPKPPPPDAERGRGRRGRRRRR